MEGQSIPLLPETASIKPSTAQADSTQVSSDGLHHSLNKLIDHRHLNCTINFPYFNPPNANPTGVVVRGATQLGDASKEARIHKQHFSGTEDEVERFLFFFPFLSVFLLSFPQFCFPQTSCFQAANSTNFFPSRVNACVITLCYHKDRNVLSQTNK